MKGWICILAATSGYLVGAIPFSLIVVRLAGKGETLRPVELDVPGTDGKLRSDAVSATAVRFQLGARYGCLTSLLDMLKAAAVTLAFKLALPKTPYFLIASGFAVVGHIWPVYNGFRGGRGQSPVIGSFFVLDWPAPLLAYPLAQLLGIITRSRAYVGRFAPVLLATAWFYVRFRDLSFVLYGLGILTIRALSMRREIKQYAKVRREGGLETLSDEIALMGYGNLLSGLISKARHFVRRKPNR